MAKTSSYGPRIVPIPGQPGEYIDARIWPDLKDIIETFKVKVTDGYATSGHAPAGEHPLGLAVDLVPDFKRGGTWDDVDRLARWAEPKQNDPRSPFRWVGYDGDPNHGRGNHLHLSWNHDGTKSVTTGKKRGGDGVTIGGWLQDASGVGLVPDLFGIHPFGKGPAGALAGDAAQAGAEAVGGVAADVAGAVIGGIIDTLGINAGKIAVTIALVVGGVALALFGLSRATGVRAPVPVPPILKAVKK